MKKIGMIGVGNMGGAILRGMIASGYVAAEDVMACLHSEEKRQALAAEIPGLTCTTDAKALAQECRMIVLAVKPQVLGELLDSIKGEINDRALVSIAAGWTMDMLTSKVAGTTATLLRVMPNTPALVGAGMTAICRQTTLSAADLAYAQGIFDAIGETAVIDEKLFDGFIAVSGRDVMPSGMVIFSSEVQVLNTSLPNDVIVWGRSICVRAVQPAKAESPILVTLSGTETPVMAVLPWNALSPIRVTDFPPISAGSSSSPETSAEQPVMVTVPSSSVV